MRDTPTAPHASSTQPHAASASTNAICLSAVQPSRRGRTGAGSKAGVSNESSPTCAGEAGLRFLVMRILRSEEHTSELQSLMRTSYAVFCLKKKKSKHKQN